MSIFAHIFDRSWQPRAIHHNRMLSHTFAFCLKYLMNDLFVHRIFHPSSNVFFCFFFGNFISFRCCMFAYIFLYKVLKLITLYGMIYISLHCLRYLSWFHVQIIICQVRLGTVQRLLNFLPSWGFQCKYGSLWFIRFLRIIYDNMIFARDEMFK